MQPAHGAVPQSNQVEEATQMSLRIPTPPREEGNFGTRGGEVYAIVPRQMEGMDVIWRDRPLLIWDVNKANPVEVALVKIYDAATGTQLWSQSVEPTDRCVAYTGEPLQPGGRYEMWLCDSKSTLLPRGRVQFQMLEPEEHGRVATELDRQVSRLQSQGATVATLTQAQANLFANQHLWADALMTLFSPENVPESLASAKQFVKDLEHITRWLQVATLAEENNSPMGAERIQIQLFTGQERKAATKLSEPYHLSYQYNFDTNEWEEPSFRVKLTNTSQKTVFLAVLNLTERYAIEPLVEGGTLRLKPGEAIWLNGGEPLYGFVPDELWEQGITMSQDVYKVIACTVDFDPSWLIQGELDDIASRERTAPLVRRPLKQILERAIVDRSGIQAVQSPDVKWMGSQLLLTSIRPSDIRSSEAA